MTRPTAILPPLILASGLGAVLLVQRQTAARWRGVVDDLRWQNREASHLRKQNVQLTLWTVPTNDLVAWRRDEAALPSERRRLEVLKYRLAFEARARLTNAPPAPLAAGLIPITALPDAGTSTPEAAAQTFFRAIGKMEPAAVAANLEITKDARTKIDPAFNAMEQASRQSIGGPKELVALLMVEMFSRATGMQVEGCTYDPQTTGRAVWNAKLQTASGRLHDISFPVQMTPSGWHEVITAAWLDRWSDYLR